MSATLTNYDGSISATPQRVARPETVEDLQTILKRPDLYPSPVRAMGSFHSLTPCASSPGTMVDMSGLTLVVSIDPERLTLTAQAGLQLVEAAAVLRTRQLQFILNVEIGNITLGSAACCHTKDALDCIEYGQLSSYVTRMKWVDPSGELKDASEESDPDLLYLMRSSHGLAGILYEVTFRLKPLEIVKLTYHRFRVDELTQREVARIRSANEGMVCWTIGRTVFIQTRNRESQLRSAWLAKQRRRSWSFTAAFVSRAIRRYTPGTGLMNQVENGWLAAQRTSLGLLMAVDGMTIWNPDKIVDYDRTPPSARYAFTFWAFPFDQWVENLQGYVEFSERHFAQSGFRCNMPLGSYAIRRDARAILSYTHEGDVLSLDPIHAPSPRDGKGWERFLEEFNTWSHGRGGSPLLNQSPFVQRAHAEAAYGDRWRRFSDWVRTVDPQARLLNPFFRDLLSD